MKSKGLKSRNYVFALKKFTTQWKKKMEICMYTSNLNARQTVKS